MERLNKFETALRTEVANHSIYVWGASGQLCCKVNEAWIRSKESRNENGKHADEAVEAWKNVMSGPYRNVARCFDCSGYVSYCLMQAGALDKRRDCDGLYDRSEPTDKFENGTLLFRVNKSNPNDETHVGVYLDGNAYEAKGRKYGVVANTFRAKDWAKYGWFKTLPHTEPQPAPAPEPEPITAYVIKVHGSVRVREGNGVLTKRIATARNCYLPYLGQATDYPYWYMTRIDGSDGYITSNPKYTEVVEGGELLG